jgi:hypothetical protein
MTFVLQLIVLVVLVRKPPSTTLWNDTTAGFHSMMNS